MPVQSAITGIFLFSKQEGSDGDGSKLSPAAMLQRLGQMRRQDIFLHHQIGDDATEFVYKDCTQLHEDKAAHHLCDEQPYRVSF